MSLLAAVQVPCGRAGGSGGGGGGERARGRRERKEGVVVFAVLGDLLMLTMLFGTSEGSCAHTAPMPELRHVMSAMSACTIGNSDPTIIWLFSAWVLSARSIPPWLCSRPVNAGHAAWHLREEFVVSFV